MNSEISRIQAGRPTHATEQVASQASVARSTEPKPLLEGGLSIRVGAYRAPGEVEGVHAVEEPSRDDPIGKLIGELFELPPPDMPNFV